MDDLDLVTFSASKDLEKCPRYVVKRILRQTKSAHHRLSLTSAMPTCSSSTADMFVDSASASDHDLANFSIKVRFVGASDARKSIAGAQVCTDGSLPAGGEDALSP